MKYLKKFESNIVNENQEMFDNFIDCFIDLIDNDPNFDKEDNIFFDIRRNNREEYISPFVDRLLPDDEFVKLSLNIGYGYKDLKSLDIESESDTDFEYYSKQLEISLENTKVSIENLENQKNFLERIKFSIIKFKSIYEDIEVYINLSLLKDGYLDIEFYNQQV